MASLLVDHPQSNSTLSLSITELSSLHSILSAIESKVEGLASVDWKLTNHQGQEWKWQPNSPFQTARIAIRLPGGKGGFGANLKKQGERMGPTRTTNFESCRDLSGNFGIYL